MPYYPVITMITEAELRAVDAFFADREKTLDNGQPDWQESGRGDYQAKWPIIDSLGVSNAHLRFRVPMSDPEFPTIGVIFRSEMVSRLDKARDRVCHPNPATAALVGLPSEVCGTHIHRWSDNRRFVQMNNIWQLPIRAPVAARLDRFDQMFKWYVDEIGVILTSEQRGFREPPRQLFQ